MRALVAIVLVLALVGPWSSSGSASGARALWWGPTGMAEGWHVRIPFSVANPGDTVLVDAVVSQDVDVKAALLAAGWPATGPASDRQLRSFALDPDSVRVVEYRALGTDSPYDGLVVGPVPAQASPGMLDTPRPFNAASDPGLRVDWVASGDFPAHSSRYFMVYLDSTSQGKKEPDAISEAQAGPLSALDWVHRGTTLYGRASSVVLVGIEDNTTAAVEAYDAFGRPHLLDVGASTTITDPVHLSSGHAITLQVGDQETLVRVRSDRPVVAVGLPHSEVARASGVVPSVDGGVFGRRFDLVDRSPSYTIYSPREPSMVTVAGRSISLTPGAPVAILSSTPASRAGTMMELTATAPVIVVASIGNQKIELPSAEGAPFGSRLLMPPAGVGQIQITTTDATDSVWGQDAQTGETRFPTTLNGASSTSGAIVTPIAPLRAGTAASSGATLFYTSPSPSDASFGGAWNLTAFAGVAASSRGDELTTPVGGHAGKKFQILWPVTVVGLHNGTLLDARQGGARVPTTGLGEGDILELSASFSSPLGLVASKPVIVIPRFAGGYFAGYDASLRVEPAGTPEYRGYLVGLSAATGDADPLLGYVAPGGHTVFKLIAKNLALDARGRSVPASMSLSAPAVADGWSVAIPGPAEFHLDGGGEKEIDVTVTPPADAAEGSRLAVPITLTSKEMPTSSVRLNLIAIVRASYDVGLWFEDENGPRSRTATFDAGTSQIEHVFVENKGSIPDRILLAATPLSTDWKAGLGDAEARFVELDLEAHEARRVDLHLVAPRENGSQSIVDVSATSLHDASKTQEISAVVRIRADLGLAVTADNATAEVLPGAEARFEIAVRNNGTDSVSLRFNTSGEPPAGWARPVVWSKGYSSIDEISALLPNETAPLSLRALVPQNATRGAVEDLHFFVETRPQFPGDPVLRRNLDFVVLVAANHTIVPRNATGIVPVEDDRLAHARLTVENHGNGNETLTIVPRRLPASASLVTTGATSVPIGGAGTVALTLRFPADAPVGVEPVVVDLVADDGFATPWAFNVSIPEWRLATLEAQAQAQGIAGVARALPVHVLNSGNVPIAFPPKLVVPAGWNVTWSKGPAILPVGAAIAANVTIQAPRDAPDAVVALAMDPAWATGAPLAWDLRSVKLVATISAVGPDVRLTIGNDGSGDATDVDVSLLEGATSVDHALLHRIPAHGNVTAILTPSTTGTAARSVVVDAAGVYGSTLTLPVQGQAGARTVPGASLAIGMLCVAAIAWSRRRRDQGP